MKRLNETQFELTQGSFMTIAEFSNVYNPEISTTELRYLLSKWHREGKLWPKEREKPIARKTEWVWVILDPEAFNKLLEQRNVRRPYKELTQAGQVARDRRERIKKEMQKQGIPEPRRGRPPKKKRRTSDRHQKSQPRPRPKPD